MPFALFSCDSCQAFAIVLFISSSPSLYICFMSFISPCPGSSSLSKLGGFDLGGNLNDHNFNHFCNTILAIFYMPEVHVHVEHIKITIPNFNYGLICFLTHW